MTGNLGQSPSFRVMNEAIELDLEGRSPYPESSMFVDADSPVLGEKIKRAAREGYAVVLAYSDGSTEILIPQNGSAPN